jgi:hypothetical protein
VVEILVSALWVKKSGFYAKWQERPKIRLESYLYFWKSAWEKRACTAAWLYQQSRFNVMVTQSVQDTRSSECGIVLW